MDEPSIRVKGSWRHLDRAVEKSGQTIDGLLAEHRDERAALRCLTQAIPRHGSPETITMDGSEASAVARRRYHADHGTATTMRQVPYLHQIVEHGHRGVKRVTGPMLRFQSCDAAQGTLTAIARVPMLKKESIQIWGQQSISATIRPFLVHH